MFFKILLGIDVAVAVVVLYFFEVGLNDGSISSFNMYLWLEMLSCVAAVLMILAVPGVSYVLFFGILIIANPRWN